MTIQTALHSAIGLLPVLFFLAALMLIDTYKLVRLRNVLISVAAGCFAALFCMWLNSALLENTGIEFRSFSRYVAPFIEESAKAAFIVFAIRKHKIGFLVDAAIHGFAVGAGFALVENIYYLNMLPEAGAFLWIIRGLGTAIMHGGVASIFAIMAKSLHDRTQSARFAYLLIPLLTAGGVHSFFNHFILPPEQSTLLVLATLPAALYFVFQLSEKATRRWLGTGFDTDQELLEMFNSGGLSASRIGRYLDEMRASFPGERVADMLCLLRLHAELAIRAKGILMLRESGFPVKPDPDVRAKLAELVYLEKSIGKTGKMAIQPLLHTDSRDLWQLRLLST